MTFRLPCNRLSVADTDAIIAMLDKGMSARLIRRKYSRPGLVLTLSEIVRLRAEHEENKERARIAC